MGNAILQTAVNCLVSQGNDTEFNPLSSSRSSASEISKLAVVDCVSLTCGRSLPATEQCH